MLAVISDNKFINLQNITQVENDTLWTEFSVAKPGTYIDPSQLSHWDGVYRKYSRSQHRLARPLLSMLKQVCDKHGFPLVVKDERENWPYGVLSKDEIGPDFLPGITLEDYQIKCIHAGVDKECMIVDVPTGGGKGELIAGLCKAITCPTVILADQTIVIDQLKVRLELRDITDDVGLFYAGKRPNGQTIVVGTIQSLMPAKKPIMPAVDQNNLSPDDVKKLKLWDKKYKAYKTRKANVSELIQYIKNAEMIIVDECDKCVSDPWKNIFRHHFNGRRRYGFSGTPIDPSKPVEALVMQEHLGSIGFKETRTHLESLGRIIPCEYIMLAYGLDGSISEASTYDIAYDEHMTYSAKFHKLVSNTCKLINGDNIGTLVLVDRTVLGDNLLGSILNAGLKCDFIQGPTSKKHRKEALLAFEARELDVLIGSKIINRGLDLKGGCENLILATGGKLQSDFIQKVGRALRVNNIGKSKIYDFLFRCNRYLYDHSKERLKTMISLGYKTTIIFPGGKVDGAEFVKNKFRVKKEWLNKPSPKLIND